MPTTTLHDGKFDQLCAELLTLIEIEENKSLAWGFTTATVDPAAVFPNPADVLPVPFAEEWRAGGYTLEMALANLEERKLLFKSGGRYRTRFAETVRLLALLRQRFSYDDWQTAGQLVSDWKVQLQRRRYPRRNISVTEVLAALRTIRVPDAQREVVSHLLTDADGEELHVAEFQRKAIEQQLRFLGETSTRGVVIGAGTGAGKTKAFYVPAFAALATQPGGVVDILALYPRVELLKDQLAEAFNEARKLDAFVRQRGRLPLALGAYYGDTPYAAAAFMGNQIPSGWERARGHDGWVCPFFVCPNPRCNDRRMVWRRDDIQREDAANARNEYGTHERLRCVGCGTEVGGDTLRLTRLHMNRRPPDVLFTTTEMLNRNLSDASDHPLFGVRSDSPPRMVLLDEIHTYEGVSGAQVAYLLRRWRHASVASASRPLTFVGLSATLADAERFFATLTGVPQHNIFYITPTDDELVDEGVEYNLVLRGDPVSGAALLSTSVQTTMLLGRVLDPLSQSAGSATVSRGAVGQKVFAFTDTLDVINRWYHIEDDAERRQILSKYRLDLPTMATDELRRRLDAGQLWRICPYIGHTLDRPLVVGLTSSQYRGVEANANVVIATSTLEVGFNDARVGAVIQHKAPRSLASFLQRKGRAGRTRAMRPWTVVVTSAYGRDRWAFQHAEQLFSPILAPNVLPLGNGYVQRIQAAYALMDWLCVTLRRQGTRANVWNLLSGFRAPDAVLRGATQLLREVLDGKRSGELERYVRQALCVDDDETMLALLWREPRPLLLDVVPTVLRQLETDWRRVTPLDEESRGELGAQTPMPSFVPPNLFTDLNLPEVDLILPDDDTRDDQHLPLVQALTEFAPGHVNKRYARREYTAEAHWLALPEGAAADDPIPLASLALRGELLAAPVAIDGVAYRVMHPHTYTLTQVPKEVRPTSRARLRWHSHFAPRTLSVSLGMESTDMELTETADVPGASLPLLPHATWRAVLPSARVYRQDAGECAVVHRLAVGIDVETRYTSGREIRGTHLFTDEERPAALGFALETDALAFAVAPLDVAALRNCTEWRVLYRSIGPRHFLHRLRTHPQTLAARLSVFETEWLWQLEFSMLVAVAVTEQCSLEAAAVRVQGDRERLAKRTMDVIFQTQAVAEDDTEEYGRLRRKLNDLIAEPYVQEVLQDTTRVLWDDSDADDYLRACYASSVGAALFTALTRLVPDIDPDELALDVVDGHVWISEQAAGGLGLVVRLADALAQQPRAFDLHLDEAVQHCDREHLATQLRAVANAVEVSDQEITAAFHTVRTETDLPHPEGMRRMLMHALEARGITATRELVVAINNKFLRPNAGTDSDALIAALARMWEREEERLGCAIDVRVIAVAAWRDPDIRAQVRAVLGRVGSDTDVPEHQAFNLLQSLLWLTCHDSCPDCIAVWQRFWEPTHPSRSLLRLVMQDVQDTITFGVAGWEEAVRESLAHEGVARLAYAQCDLSACKAAVQRQLTTPVEVAYQVYYPAVEGIARTSDGGIVRLVIGELLHD